MEPAPRPNCWRCGSIASLASLSTIPLCHLCMFDVWKAYGEARSGQPACIACETREVERELRSERSRSIGMIYFLRVDGLVKIGWAYDLEKRLEAYPPTATLLAVKPGTRADERTLHGLFNEYLEHGREWFTPGPFLLEHIEQVVAAYGAPPELRSRSHPVTTSEPNTLQTKARAKGRRKHDGSAAVKRPDSRPRPIE